MGIHAPQQDGHRSGLAAPIQNVGVPPHIHLGGALPHGGDLSPLVCHRQTQRRRGHPVGQSPHQVPEQRGLPRPRRGKNQGILQPLPLHQLGKQGLSLSHHRAGNAHGQGGNLPQGGHLPVPHHSGAADADAVPATQGEKPPLHLIQHRVGRGLAGLFQHLPEQFPRHHQLSHVPLSVSIQHRGQKSLTQADLLHPFPLLLGQLFEGTPEMLRHQGNHLLKWAVHHVTPSLSYGTPHCMRACPGV